MKLRIDGNPSPDCRIAATSDGTTQWTWNAGGHTWYLWKYLGFFWVITDTSPAWDGPYGWLGPGNNAPTPLGNYARDWTAQGTITVTEAVASKGNMMGGLLF